MGNFIWQCIFSRDHNNRDDYWKYASNCRYYINDERKGECQTMNSVILFILSVCIASTSQILLKKSANQQYQSKWQEYLNKYVIGAYGLLFASTILTMLAYKNLNLSMGVMIESISYIIIAIASYFIFKEKITKSKQLGILLIIAGIIIASVF